MSIITVNYNGLNDTCALIDSIPFNEDMEVIVVDNGSIENEAEILQTKYSYIKAIRSDHNLGFAGGNNLGIKASRGQYLYLVNNDTIFKVFNPRVLINRLKSSQKIGMVCPKIRFAWDNNPIQYAGYTQLSSITIRNSAIGCGEDDQGQYDTPHLTPYAHGAAMMFKREIIDKVGFMPECYFLYYEELDWSMTIARSGYEIWYEPASTIYHKESQSTGQNSPLRTYFITRNRLLLVKRNWSGFTKHLSYCYLIFIVATRDIFKYVLQGKFKLAIAVQKGIFNFQFSTFN